MQDHKGIGSDAIAVDFSRATGHAPAAPDAFPDGDVLLLEPNWQAVRPAAPAAVILPEHRPPAEGPDQGANGADFYDYSLDAVRPAVPRPPNFAAQLSRPDDTPELDTRDYR